MAIPVLQTGWVFSKTNGVADNITVVECSGIQVGDFLQIKVMDDADNETVNLFDTPAGWTLISHAGDGTSDSHVAAYWKFADAGDTGGGGAANVNVTHGGVSDEIIGWMSRVTGVNTTNPINSTAASKTEVSNFITIETLITTDVDDCLCFGAWCFDGGDGYPFGTPANGWVKQAEGQENTDGNTTSGGFLTREMPTAGSTQWGNLLASVTDGWGSIAWALAPAAEAGTTYYETLTPTAVGTSVLGTLTTHFRAISYTGVGSVSISKLISKYLSYSAIGTNVFTRTATFYRSYSYSGIGTVAFTKGLLYSIAADMTATGTLVGAWVATHFRAYAYAGVGSSSIVKAVGKILAYPAVGVSVFTKLATHFMSRSYSATGTPLFTKALLSLITANMIAAGGSVLSRIITYSNSLSYSGVGSSTVTKLIGKTLSYTSVGAESLTKAATYLRTYSFGALGTASLTKALFSSAHANMTAIGTAVSSYLAVIGVTSLITAIGSSSVSKFVSKSLAYSSTGTASVIKRAKKTFSSSATGTSLGGQQLVVAITKTLTFIATGVSNLTTQFIAAPPPAIRAVIKRITAALGIGL